MLPLVRIDDLAADWTTSLELGDDATPQCPVIAVDLDTAAGHESLEAAATSVRRCLPIVVGVATRPVDPRLERLVAALDVTLSLDHDDRPELVHVDDATTALTALADAIGAKPRAAVTLGQVLRQTEQLDVRAGLAAEAAAYSMLLAGREFKAWLATRGTPRPTTPGPSVKVERHGDVVSVVLDRPERRNAVDAAVRDELVEALTVALAASEVRVELSGRGDNFSSGGDLDEFGSADEVDGAYLVRLERHPGFLLHQLGERAHVTVHGACIGAGIEIPSFAHRVSATPDAYFALPEVNMGVIPGAGGTVGIPRRIGRWRTAWLALTGARIDAVTAHDWGLVDEVVRA